MSCILICNTSNWSTNCDKLQSFSLNVSANQIISEADAIHNALILLVCSLALLIVVSFRNRKTNHPKIK